MRPLLPARFGSSRKCKHFIWHTYAGEKVESRQTSLVGVEEPAEEGGQLARITNRRMFQLPLYEG